MKFSVLCLLLTLAALPAFGQGTEEQGPKPGCALIAPQKVQAVFGAFTDAQQSGGYIPGAQAGGVKLVENAMTTCLFRRQASGEVLQIIGNWFPSYEEASAAFERASKAQTRGTPYYTSTAKKGPMQFFEGQGRSLGYLSNSLVMIHWFVVKGKTMEPANVPGSKLTPLAVQILCPAFPNCKIPALK